jgi:hypothetical protein
MADSRGESGLPSNGGKCSPENKPSAQSTQLRTGEPKAAAARDGLSHTFTHLSAGHDAPLDHAPSTEEIPDEVYDRLSHGRKLVVVTLLSFCSFLSPISSTTILAATPEVADEYGTSGSIINLSNALYMLWMGISPLVWGPLSQVYGRRPVSILVKLY